MGGAPEEMARLRQASATPVSTAELTAAFAADDGAALQVVGLLSRDAQRVLTEMPFTLPPSLGGQSILDYTQGLDAVTLAVDLPPRPAVTAALTAQDEAAAQRLAAAFNGLFKSIPQTPWFTQELHTDSPGRKEALRKLLTEITFTASGRTAISARTRNLTTTARAISGRT